MALATAILTRPHWASIVFGVLWLGAWGFGLARPDLLAAAIDRGPAWALPSLAAGAMALATLDGGHAGTLGTQPLWLVAVAATTTGWRIAAATGGALFAAKLGAFVATGTAPPPLGENTVLEARTAVLMPLALVPLALALAALAQRVVAALAAHRSPATTELSPAQAEIVELLAKGLSAKQIALARGTSVETVRTQIKHAKRATRARTQEHLVAIAQRPA